MKIVVWLAEGTWPACVDAARRLPAGELALVHVIDPGTAAVAGGARAGLLGRGAGGTSSTMDATLAAAQADLLDAAERRAGRPVTRYGRRGRPEREVLAACTGADLLVVAREGDRTRLGPRSLGSAARFVVDHAPCAVLLVWPGNAPAAGTAPPPPPPGGPPPHPPPR